MDDWNVQKPDDPDHCRQARFLVTILGGHSQQEIPHKNQKQQQGRRQSRVPDPVGSTGGTAPNRSADQHQGTEKQSDLGRRFCYPVKHQVPFPKVGDAEGKNDEEGKVGDDHRRYMQVHDFL